MQSRPKFDHAVVLMLENRSFDNMVGWLYNPDNHWPFNHVPRGQAFDGLSGKKLSNPFSGPFQRTSIISAGRTFDPVTPPLDPGETFHRVNRQIYGHRRPNADDVPNMKGFVRDYAKSWRSARGCALLRPPHPDNAAPIMQGFTPETVPIISHLAYHYAICDRWFASVPSQTWANRSFLNAATSGGLVNNRPYVRWALHDAPTIFNRIQDAVQPNLSWRVYHSSKDLLPLTLLIHLRQLSPYLDSHFANMEQFEQDAADGRLPSYALIEPDYMGKDQNDQHPPSSVTAGETLIERVYRAVRYGKSWERTLLIITYDEHGGCFDHVPPPAAVPPDSSAPRGQCGFSFDRLGVRVPTILISPYVERGTVYRPRLREGGGVAAADHTAIIRTVTHRFGLASLTERDKAAPLLDEVLSRRYPRSDDPKITQVESLSNRMIYSMERREPLHRSQLIRDVRGLAHAHWTALKDDSIVIRRRLSDMVERLDQHD